MDPYPSSLVDGSLSAVSKILCAARAELERRPSAPEAAQDDLDALPWSLPGGKMDTVEQCRGGAGGPVLSGWAATAHRELIEEVGRGGAARLKTAQARRVATQVVEARAGWLVPLLLVAVEGGAAADAVFIPNGEFRTARWAPLAQARAACADGSSGDMTLLEDDEWLALFQAAGPELGPAPSAGSASVHSATATAAAPAIAGWAFEDGCEEKDREWWAAAVFRPPSFPAAASSGSQPPPHPANSR
jgi:8-oxo-dGTP pyrophosphatase MutT (NUDIX family)